MNRREFVLTTAAAAPIEAAGSSDGYGPELRILSDLGIGMSSAAAIAGNRLYVVGGGALGSLYVFDIDKPALPKLVGKLAGLGHVRQMQVRGSIAYVTSREDGMFLIDVGKSERPAILSHYDTIELATGLALSGSVAFVACRQCGVELIDITNPKRPAHLSTVRVGEAQSVTARNGYLYAGVWGTRELVVCDVGDPRQPRRVGSAELEGYGDGVAVRGKLCYVATGHHSGEAGYQRPKPGQPGFGTGHGLEIFDVSEPARPQFLSRIKTPARYRVFMDMWGVQLAGSYAFLADTYNGLFVIDVADPKQPRFVGHRQLPEVPARGEGYVLVPGETVPSPVTGFALSRDFIYVTGGYSDAHVLSAPGLATPVVPEPDRGPVITPARRLAADPRFRVYQPGGQIHEVRRWDGDKGSSRFVLAAGSAGIHVVELDTKIRQIGQYPTSDIAFGVAVAGDKVFVAGGMGGLEIWQGKQKLELVGRYKVPGESIKQVVVDPTGRYAMLHVGLHRLEIVDVSTPSDPKKVLTEAHFGLFYRRPISQALLNGQGLVIWTEGLYAYEIGSSKAPDAPVYHYPFAITPRNGAVPLGDGWLVIFSGKYFVLRPGETRSPDKIGLTPVEGVELFGKPTISGNTLFTADALYGKVCAIDISDITKPKLLASMEVPEHPGHIVGHNNVALIPGGYQGLLEWHFHSA